MFHIRALVRFAAALHRQRQPVRLLRRREAALRDCEIERGQMAAGDMIRQIGRRELDGLRKSSHGGKPYGPITNVGSNPNTTADWPHQPTSWPLPLPAGLQSFDYARSRLLEGGD